MKKYIALILSISLIAMSFIFFDRRSNHLKSEIKQSSIKSLRSKNLKREVKRPGLINVKSNRKKILLKKKVLPKSNKEFQNFVKKEIKALNFKLKKLKNNKMTTKYKAKQSELYALKTLLLFEYIGNNKKGIPKLRLKENAFFKKDNIKNYNLKKNYPKAKRLIAESSLFNLNLTGLNSKAKHDKNIIDKKIGLYNPSTKIRETFLDKLGHGLEKMGLISNNPLLIHNDNLKMISEIKKKALLNPKLYGIRNNKLIEVTEIEYNIYAQTIKNKISAKFGLIGGTISGTASNQLLRFAKSAILVIGLEAVKGITFDSMFMALAVNTGIKQLFALSSYYKYIEQSKEQALIEGEYFDYQKTKDNFDLKDLFLSELFKREMQKSWIFGHFVMMIKDYYKKDKSKEDFFNGLALSTMSWLGTPSVIPMFFATVKLLSNMISGKTIAAILSVTGKKVKFIPSWLKNFVTGPWKLISLPLDIAVQSASMFSLIHMRLHGAALIFNNTYAHPATVVHLTKNQKYKNIKSFDKVSKKIFFPLCTFLAKKRFLPRKKISILTTDRFFEKDLKSCIKTNLIFQNNNKLSFKEVDKAYQRFKENLYNDKNIIPREDLIINILKNAYKFPDHYKILWQTGLKEIAKTRTQKKYFKTIKNILLLGTSEQKWFKEYLRYHLFELKSFENYRKLDLMINTISDKTNQEYGDTFRLFYKYHTKVAKNIGLKLKKRSLYRNDSVFSILIKEASALKESLVFAFDSYNKMPSQNSYKEKIKKEVAIFQKILN